MSDQRTTSGPLQMYMTDSGAGPDHCVELSVALSARKSDCLPRSSIKFLRSAPAYLCSIERGVRTFSTLCGHVSSSSGSIKRKRMRAGRRTRAFLRFRQFVLSFQFLNSHFLSSQVPQYFFVILGLVLNHLLSSQVCNLSLLIPVLSLSRLILGLSNVHSWSSKSLFSVFPLSILSLVVFHYQSFNPSF